MTPKQQRQESYKKNLGERKDSKSFKLNLNVINRNKTAPIVVNRTRSNSRDVSKNDQGEVDEVMALAEK